MGAATPFSVGDGWVLVDDTLRPSAVEVGRRAEAARQRGEVDTFARVFDLDPDEVARAFGVDVSEGG